MFSPHVLVWLVYSSIVVPFIRTGVAQASCISRQIEDSDTTTPRIQLIKNMYAFSGFVYAINDCPNQDKLTTDFSKMKASGARTVLTFDHCDSSGYYGEVIKAAGTVGIHVIPLVWTLHSGSWSSAVTPQVTAVTKAVIANPGPVLAVAFGDEPLFDHDAGSPSQLASYIKQMKSDLKNAGLSDIPISISDMAYGWQSAGDIAPVAAAVDFFMINNFPYFNSNAESGGSSVAWKDFTNDIAYFESIANGRPLLVTQTGWPSNKDLWPPSSPNVVASVSSEEAYWKLLDSHCADFFKAKNIGWMWRGWDDTLDGWGVLKTDGTKKWDFSAKVTC
ncbi:glycoside hydrolase [Rickenella mellea]|uniref:glucan endo-1,3-beta-D-glucosidase n=1 Tax=Rickenella mellea TaxID=50990 RepID=A0A4Y7QIB3_9AGAM|nr:glycoside hydrolase [Rickenella mellea]